MWRHASTACQVTGLELWIDSRHPTLQLQPQLHHGHRLLSPNASPILLPLHNWSKRNFQAAFMFGNQQCSINWNLNRGLLSIFNLSVFVNKRPNRNEHLQSRRSFLVQKSGRVSHWIHDLLRTHQTYDQIQKARRSNSSCVWREQFMWHVSGGYLRREIRKLRAGWEYFSKPVWEVAREPRRFEQC